MLMAKKIAWIYEDQKLFLWPANKKKKLGPSIETKTGNPWFTILLSLLIKIWQVLVFNMSFVNSLNT